jgi:hypothetical protein
MKIEVHLQIPYYDYQINMEKVDAILIYKTNSWMRRNCVWQASKGH